MMQTIVKTFLIFSVLFIISDISAQEDKYINEMKMVDAYLASGDITKALVTIEDILVRSPAFMPAQEKKLDILIQNDRSKDALRDIEEYITMYPGHSEYYYLRAIWNLQKQKIPRAIDDFNTAIQLAMPDNIAMKVYLNRGIAYFSNQDFELAEGDFDEVIAKDSRNAAAYHGKGMVKYELGLYDEAVTEFTKSLKYEENNAITHFNMAMSYFRLGENDNACYHFNKSCVLGHRNACRLLMMECDINLTQ